MPWSLNSVEIVPSFTAVWLSLGGVRDCCLLPKLPQPVTVIMAAIDMAIAVFFIMVPYCFLIHPPTDFKSSPAPETAPPSVPQACNIVAITKTEKIFIAEILVWLKEKTLFMCVYYTNKVFWSSDQNR
jgi:hypothetical protein